MIISCAGGAAHNTSIVMYVPMLKPVQKLVLAKTQFLPWFLQCCCCHRGDKVMSTKRMTKQNNPKNSNTEQIEDTENKAHEVCLSVCGCVNVC